MWQAIKIPVKRVVKIAINKVLAPLGYTIRHRGDFDPLEMLFYRYLHDDFFFVQVGANDGVTRDPIFRLVTETNVRGLVIEPIPDYFTKLTRAYQSHPNVTAVNKAIHATEKEVTMYRADPSISDASGIASLDPNHHRRSGVPDAAIIPQVVPAISFEELVEHYGVTHIDLLQIDAEGYDFEIIRMAAKFRPKLIHFEHGMPSEIMTIKTFLDCAHYLLERGYLLVVQHYDAIAYLPPDRFNDFETSEHIDLILRHRSTLTDPF